MYVHGCAGEIKILRIASVVLSAFGTRAGVDENMVLKCMEVWAGFSWLGVRSIYVPINCEQNIDL
jgi:hypothetical protein